MIVIFQIRNKN